MSASETKRIAHLNAILGFMRRMTHLQPWCGFEPARRGCGAGDFLGSIFRKPIESHHYQWHEIDPPMFTSVRLLTGGKSRPTGKLWRRRTLSGQWEYRQDAETYDEFLDRQW